MGLPDNESHRRGNHGRPKSGIPKRKKTSTHTRLSCKIEYLPRPNQPDRSSASEFFTDDYLRVLKCPALLQHRSYPWVTAPTQRGRQGTETTQSRIGTHVSCWPLMMVPWRIATPLDPSKFRIGTKF